MRRQQISKKKNREIKEPVKWDKKSTINLIILFSCVVAIFLIYNNWNNIKEFAFKDKYQNTKGKIERFESIQIPYETRTGQRIMTKYRIEYSYSVNGKRYEKSELINENPNNVKVVFVEYDVENPSNASLEIE